jgi:hypothetical protein
VVFCCKRFSSRSFLSSNATACFLRILSVGLESFGILYDGSSRIGSVSGDSVTGKSVCSGVGADGVSSKSGDTSSPSVFANSFPSSDMLMLDVDDTAVFAVWSTKCSKSKTKTKLSVFLIVKFGHRQRRFYASKRQATTLRMCKLDSRECGNVLLQQLMSALLVFFANDSNYSSNSAFSAANRLFLGRDSGPITSTDT